MSKVIGIICGSESDRFCVKDTYVQACQLVGAQVIGIMPQERIEEILSLVDGILLAGGPDVDPIYYNQPTSVFNGAMDPLRDEAEIRAVQYSIQNKLPLLAICRGMQILNVALGGDLFQDIYIEHGTTLQHEQKAPRWYATHSVNIVEEAALGVILGEQKVRVNSFHHQALRRLGKGIVSVAKSEDGIIEGVEVLHHPFAIGLQWHPEDMVNNTPQQFAIFNAFLKACHEGRKK